MGAVTYPNTKVSEFISQKMVPLQILSDSPLSADFQIKWTPTLIVLDYYGKEHHRAVGFFPPEELVPFLMLGMAKTDFDTEQFNDAIIHLDTLLKEFPQSAAAPEAVFLRGVSRYKSSHDPMPLREAYDKLQAEYPASEWAKRADPYKLIG